MPGPESLAPALALAACVGLNTYMVAFLLGLAVRMGWVGGAGYSGFAFLAEPWWMAVAGGLYLIDFAIDKVPWLNTWWHVPHTIVRAAGGFLVGNILLGSIGWGIVCALVAVIVHTAHAGLRGRINRSPEPFSNVASSVARDGLVLGGFTLALRDPGSAGIATGGFVLICALYTIRVWRKSIAAVRSWRAKPPAVLEPEGEDEVDLDASS